MTTRLNSLYRRVLAGMLCSLIVLHAPVVAAQTSIGLTIQVLEGNGAQNIVLQPVPKPISVRIMDRTGRVLPGATVEFAPPEYGAGGEFESKLSPIIVTTNSQGIAVAPQFRANSTPGNYQIQIVAPYMGEVSRVLLSQNNVIKKKSSNKLFIISAVVGGAAAAAFAAKGGGGGGGSPSTPPAPTPSPGVPTAPSIVFLDSSVTAPR